ncbi:hypothetical protein B0O99DRAFT_513763 [Bisporella sp. PMI_857]|nr:hypothetical protein B0O99DRAFT_513763 [Bisporella sp. PMI_857]
MKVAVIGAGPAGLTTLKHLLTAHQFQETKPIEARLFEAKEQVGGTFRYRVYEDAELVSSKYLTTFSDFRLPLSEPDFISTVRYCQYLEDYATNFNLWQHINLRTPIVSIRRADDGLAHIVRYVNEGVEEEWECDAVAVCTGLHIEPAMPRIPGIENVEKVIHSSQFKSRKDFGEGKNVLILGAGETAMDIAQLAVTSPTKSVTLCHRDGWVHAPKILSVPIFLSYFNKGPQHKKPADTTVPSLFDTAYVHPILQKSNLLWAAYDKWAKFYFYLISGTKHGLDQWVGGVSDERYHLSRVVLCKSNKALPYMNAPYRTPTLLNRIRSKLLNIPMPKTDGLHIDVTTWPTNICNEGFVTFTQNNRPESKRMMGVRYKPDIVVYCTGFQQRFPFLPADYPVPLDATHRGIWEPSMPSVGFIGFVRPSFGAIPPLAELQAQTWVLSLLDKLPDKPTVDMCYKLKFGTYRRDAERYVVDHESYAYQLALDMGSAPRITEVAGFGFKTLFTWALGSNFNSKFRLVGPWKWDGAKGVMEGELWGVVKHTGFWIFFLTNTILPFIFFGILSILLWVVFSVVDHLSVVAQAAAHGFRRFFPLHVQDKPKEQVRYGDSNTYEYPATDIKLKLASV